MQILFASPQGGSFGLPASFFSNKHVPGIVDAIWQISDFARISPTPGEIVLILLKFSLKSVDREARRIPL